MKYGLLIIILLVSFSGASAFSDTSHIPIGRQSRHDDIKNMQIAADRLDGKIDNQLRAGNNDAVNEQLTDMLFRKPNEFRQWIETNDAQIPENNDKVRFLRYVKEELSAFINAVKTKELLLTDLPALLADCEKIMKAKANGEPALQILKDESYAFASVHAKVFWEEDERFDAGSIVFLKRSVLYPEKILTTIQPYANEPYADSLIVIACRYNPIQFYTHAQSENSVVGKLIHRNTDDFVKLVAALSTTENALLYFPFLDDLKSGRQNIDDIRRLVGDGVNGYDSVGYYKLLVHTAIAYSNRMRAPLLDTPVAYNITNGLLWTLKRKALDHFITPINTLHDESNLNIRMHAIQPLSPEDLYYMIVMGENDIYTSSYKHSFNRLMQIMGPKPKGDSLLLSVNFDHFRKFIKMAANYNKLDTFLKTMPANRSEMLMKFFVSNLDNSNLEDAVDVADSYSSITDKKLQESMLANVKANEEAAIAAGNKRGKIIYGLLKNVFLSADENNPLDISALTGIPPIYEVGNKYLQDEQGRIVEQVFFYGDKDGRTYYPPFKNSFSSKDWKVTEKKEWMEAVSLKGNVYVYANRPLETNDNLDDTAQIHLISYMKDQGMTPSVVVHRGHSYWLDRTMKRMQGNAKIVVLGSCGGYQNLNEILEMNPDAHIISTKEIGAGDINRPILNYMHNVFESSQTLYWRKMWQTLSKGFSSEASNIRDSWDDYVPPYKNLGAIFLKAYNKKMEEE